MAVTIYDIAQEANVGIGTVSRVLNNSPKVTSETRDRVIKVAKRLNYQPHAFAQALARKRSSTLSAIIPFFTNYFFIQVLQGVQETLTTLGYDLIIHGTNTQEHVDEYLQRSLRKGRTDGTLLFSLELPQRYADEFLEKKIPLVLVDTYHPSFDSIRTNNYEGTRIAIEHLLSLGHTNIGMINANLQSSPARERLQSFKETLQKHGIEVNEKNIVNSKNIKSHGFTRESGFDCMQEFYSRNVKMPTAFFVSSDVQAIGVIGALKEHQFHVPNDVSIISFDDIELADHFDLTTMRQPMYEMGELAVKKILQRIENPAAPISLINFTPELIIRASCGANKNYIFSESN